MNQLYTVHHLLKNSNKEIKDSQSKVEKICAWICDKIGSPITLALACVIQFLWIIIGQLTKIDPYPFAFLLTISNVIQLILIFILAVGQRQSTKRSEIMAQNDHDSIAYILHHQDLQEKILIKLAESSHIDISEEIKEINNLNS